MPDICVASHHNTIAKLLDDAEFRALTKRPGCLVELRLDNYSDLMPPTVENALSVYAPRCIVTCRHPAEGGGTGAFGFTDKQRVEYLQRAADFGVRYVDIEGRTPLKKFKKQHTQVIRSFHDFKRVPPLKDLKAKWDHLAKLDADVIKIAVTPKTIHDTLPLLDLLEYGCKKKIPTLVLAMGEAGLWTRVLAGKFNAPFTFARAENAEGTAPGQPAWNELQDLYRFGQIESDWPVYAVIGDPIAHSLSPLMHNTALRAAGLKGVYLPLRIEGDPKPVLEELTRVGLRGVSITIPHKEALLSAKNVELDPVAKKIGAINTLQYRPNRKTPWFATNTDAIAAADSLLACSGGLKGKKVVILGAGGAARAVAFGIKKHGAALVIVNRKLERAMALAKDVGGEATVLGMLAGKHFDAVVNTTPVGMYPNVELSPLERGQIPQGSIVFDTVYNPLRTKLLRLAEEAGCKTLSGLEMFVGQGVRQFELWTKKQAPRDIMLSCVKDVLRQR